MKSFLSRSFAVLFVVLLSISSLVIFNVKAQARTIVVPDDYPTIQEAITASTDGDSIFIKEGRYDGPQKQTLVINKSISLIGENTKNTVFTLYPDWDYNHFPNYPENYFYDTGIIVRANDVEISSLTILTKTVPSNSETLVSGGDVVTIGNKTQITNCVVYSGFAILEGSNHIITGNTIDYFLLESGSFCLISNNKISTALRVMGDAVSNEIFGNLITGSSTGLLVRGSNNLVFNNTITGCDRGISVFGELDECYNNIFYFNELSNNTLGIDMMARGDNLVFFANYIANNDCGVAVRRDYSPADGVFYGNSFVDNIVQVNTDLMYVFGDGRKEIAYHAGLFDNGTFGNYWSDYGGIDVNGDGIGDSPYVIDENRTDHYPLMDPYTTTEITIPSFPSPTIEPDHFPTTIVLTSVVIIAVVGLGIFAFFKKRRS